MKKQLCIHVLRAQHRTFIFCSFALNSLTMLNLKDTEIKGLLCFQTEMKSGAASWSDFGETNETMQINLSHNRS